MISSTTTAYNTPMVENSKSPMLTRILAALNTSAQKPRSAPQVNGMRNNSTTTKTTRMTRTSSHLTGYGCSSNSSPVSSSDFSIYADTSDSFKNPNRMAAHKTAKSVHHSPENQKIATPPNPATSAIRPRRTKPMPITIEHGLAYSNQECSASREPNTLRQNTLRK